MKSAYKHLLALILVIAMVLGNMAVGGFEQSRVMAAENKGNEGGEPGSSLLLSEADGTPGSTPAEPVNPQPRASYTVTFDVSGLRTYIENTYGIETGNITILYGENGVGGTARSSIVINEAQDIGTGFGNRSNDRGFSYMISAIGNYECSTRDIYDSTEYYVYDTEIIDAAASFLCYAY